MEVVGEDDLGDDHRPDPDHDQRPGEGQRSHPAIGHEQAKAVHAPADLLLPVGVKRCADADHEQGRDHHHGGRHGEHSWCRRHGQERAADAGAEHVAGALERAGKAIRPRQLLVGDQVGHRALDGCGERTLRASREHHCEDGREHVAVPDEEGAGAEPNRGQHGGDHDDDTPVVTVADMAGPWRHGGRGAEDDEHRPRQPPRRPGGRVERPDQRRERRTAAGIRQPLADRQAADCGV